VADKGPHFVHSRERRELIGQSPRFEGVEEESNVRRAIFDEQNLTLHVRREVRGKVPRSTWYSRQACMCWAMASACVMRYRVVAKV
jgi:hypothetical protein